MNWLPVSTRSPARAVSVRNPYCLSPKAIGPVRRPDADLVAHGDSLRSVVGGGGVIRRTIASTSEGSVPVDRAARGSPRLPDQDRA